MLYVAMLVRHASPVLSALWQACPQLRALLVQDLQTLHRLCPKARPLPLPADHPQPWFEVMRDYPTAWKTWVKSTMPALARELAVAH
eukprot:2411700-Alexandrium_andersonii.AAC.1